MIYLQQFYFSIWYQVCEGGWYSPQLTNRPQNFGKRVGATPPPHPPTYLANGKMVCSLYRMAPSSASVTESPFSELWFPPYNRKPRYIPAVWGEITYPFPYLNGIWEWISNFIPHFTGHVITYPCWVWSWSVLVKWGPCRRRCMSYL